MKSNELTERNEQEPTLPVKTARGPPATPQQPPTDSDTAAGGPVVFLSSQRFMEMSVCVYPLPLTLISTVLPCSEYGSTVSIDGCGNLQDLVFN